MTVTQITKVRNNTLSTYQVRNKENTNKLNNPTALPRRDTHCRIWIPWCWDPKQWNKHHIEITNAATLDVPLPPGFCWIWQHGEYVRYSTSGKWHNPGTRVPGDSGISGDRILVIDEGGKISFRVDWNP